MDQGESAAALRDIIARIAAAREGARGVALEAQRRADRAAWHETLRARCDHRGVPRASDIRRCVFMPELTLGAGKTLGTALARRGDPRHARWALVVLLGGTGIGKTSALAWSVARHAREARYALARDAASALVDRPRAFESERDAAELCDTLRAVDLLALDELGTEPQRDSAELLGLASHRCDEGRATVLAGNLSLAQFVARYLEQDARFASRLASPRGCLVDLSGEDSRAEAAP